MQRQAGKSGFVPVALIDPGEGDREFTSPADDVPTTWAMKVQYSHQIPATLAHQTWNMVA